MCQKRSVEYFQLSDGYAIVLMVFASSLMVLSLAVAVLFAIHRSTPVVRSAGGSMCFLMLGCLSVSPIGVFFFLASRHLSLCLFLSRSLSFLSSLSLSFLSSNSLSLSSPLTLSLFPVL